ncbi:MAG: lipoate--protein ligase [Clostridia bacterium]|nr:lipoate--protein ligase [Clostridia bacterium]
MRVIYNDGLDPFFNLAAEEYLLENGATDYFMVWRNAKSVIIGKNQNAYGEINAEFCEKNGISIVRRLTGGGAVFHDPGNVNFTFITDAEEGESINFYPFMEKITAALSEFGIEARANGRNDIEADGFKISGNAQCVYNCRDGRKRLLHHGTLLFSADMASLAGALNPKKEKLESKGIKSVRSRVANISKMEGYRGPDSAEEFACALVEKCAEGAVTRITPEEAAAIGDMAERKYSAWEWNFGESPRFSDSAVARFPFGTVEITYTARKGIIEEIKIQGDFFATGDIFLLERGLAGTSLEKKELLSAFSDVNKYIHGASAEDIANMF